jgi:isopenicillin-N epimerase
VNENPPQLGRPASPAAEWALDPTIAYLNHGSFGACMRAILDVQQGWRTKLETHPTRFLARDLEDLLDWARSEFASFVGVDSDDLALVANTTAAINTVLRSLHFDRGDEVLATDHAYNSCTKALRYVAAKDGAKVVLARIPFPLNHELAVAGPAARHQIRSAASDIGAGLQLPGPIRATGIDPCRFCRREPHGGDVNRRTDVS